MRFSLAFLGTLAISAVASPNGPRKYGGGDNAYSKGLIGYGKDNPIGPTTGGKGSKTVTISTAEALLAKVQGNKPKTIYVKGSISLPERLTPSSNKSILSIGATAEILENGISITNQTNVVIRNFAIRFILGDNSIAILGTICELGPDAYNGQLDIVRASDWITILWNYFHDQWKSSLVGNLDVLRDVDFGTLHITYHHNYWRNEGTRGPAGRFGHQHIFNNLYKDFRYQAIHSRSDNQVLVEANVFRSNTRIALTTYGLVIPENSPNTSPEGDFEIDSFANLGAKNDFGDAIVNITQVGDFTEVPYEYKLTSLKQVQNVVKAGAGVGKIRV